MAKHPEQAAANFADVCGDINFFPVTVRKVEQHQERISYFLFGFHSFVLNSLFLHFGFTPQQHFLPYQR